MSRSLVKANLNYLREPLQAKASQANEIKALFNYISRFKSEQIKSMHHLEFDCFSGFRFLLVDLIQRGFLERLPMNIDLELLLQLLVWWEWRNLKSSPTPNIKASVSYELGWSPSYRFSEMLAKFVGQVLGKKVLVNEDTLGAIYLNRNLRRQ